MALVFAPPRSHSTRHLPDASSCQEGHQHARYHACLPWEPREAPVAMCLPRMDMDTASPVALTTPVLRQRPARTSGPHVAMSEAQQHTHGRCNDHTGTRCATSHARPYVLICRPPPQLGTSRSLVTCLLHFTYRLGHWVSNVVSHGVTLQHCSVPELMHVCKRMHVFCMGGCMMPPCHHWPQSRRKA